MIMNGRNQPKTILKNRSLDTSRQGQMEKVVLSRGCEIDIQYQVICIAERLTLSHSGNVYTCLLLGHIETNAKTGTHRIILNGVEPTTRKKFLENHDRCLGEVFVPMRIFKTEKNWKPLSSEGMVAMMESVSILDGDNEEGDVASSLALFVCGVVDRQSGCAREWGLTRLEAIALLPGRAFYAVRNVSLALQPSPLSEHLLLGMRCGEWMDSRSGFVTLDSYTRKAVLLMSSDPKVYEVPLLGIWLHGVHGLSDPAVWLWAQRFLRDVSLQKACALPHEPFLAVFFPPGASLPVVFDLFVPLESPLDSLDFAVLWADCSSAQIRDGLSLLALEPPTSQCVLDTFSVARQRVEGTISNPACEMYPRRAAPSGANCAPCVLPEVPDVSLLPDSSQLLGMEEEEEEEEEKQKGATGASHRLLSGKEIVQPKFPVRSQEGKTGKAKKKKKIVKPKLRGSEDAVVQTSFDANKPLLVSRAASTASLENCCPLAELSNLQQLLQAKEAELQTLRAEVQRLRARRPPLRDAAVNTSLWLSTPAVSMREQPAAPCSESRSCSLSEAPFSVPSLASRAPDLGPETSEFSASMALGESASMWQHLAAQSPLPESAPSDGNLNCQKMIENLQLILSRQSSSRQSETESAPSPHLKEVARTPISSIVTSDLESVPSRTLSNVPPENLGFTSPENFGRVPPENLGCADFSSVPPETLSASPPDEDVLDMSMEINLLAQKYLDPRRIVKRAEVTNGGGVSMYGIHPSDLTQNTRQYMEKYGLLPACVAAPPAVSFGDTAELSGCPAGTLIKSDKLMRLPVSLLADASSAGHCDGFSDASGDSEVSDPLSNDTNFCLPPNGSGRETEEIEEEEEEQESEEHMTANSDSCVHVLAGYQRQPPLPVPSSLLQSTSGVFASPKRRRRPRGQARPAAVHISRASAPIPDGQSIKVLDLEKIRQTPKLL